MVGDIPSRHKINYIDIFLDILRTPKLLYWLKSYGDFAEGGGVCLLEELHWEGSAPAACSQGSSSNIAINK